MGEKLANYTGKSYQRGKIFQIKLQSVHMPNTFLVYLVRKILANNFMICQFFIQVYFNVKMHGVSAVFTIVSAVNFSIIYARKVPSK